MKIDAPGSAVSRWVVLLTAELCIAEEEHRMSNSELQASWEIFGNGVQGRKRRGCCLGRRTEDRKHKNQRATEPEFPLRAVRCVFPHETFISAHSQWSWF